MVILENKGKVIKAFM